MSKRQWVGSQTLSAGTSTGGGMVVGGSNTLPRPALRRLIHLLFRRRCRSSRARLRSTRGKLRVHQSTRMWGRFGRLESRTPHLRAVAHCLKSRCCLIPLASAMSPKSSPNFASGKAVRDYEINCQPASVPRLIDIAVTMWSEYRSHRIPNHRNSDLVVRDHSVAATTVCGRRDVDSY